MRRDAAGSAAERQVITERITVGLIPKVADELDHLRDVTGLSKTDLVNRAVSLSAFVTDRLNEGYELVLRDPELGVQERVHLL